MFITLQSVTICVQYLGIDYCQLQWWKTIEIKSLHFLQKYMLFAENFTVYYLNLFNFISHMNIPLDEGI